MTRQEAGECLLLGGLLAATLGLFGSGFLSLLLSNRSVLAGAPGLLSSLILLVVVGGLALGAFRSRLGRCLSGSSSGGFGRTTTSLGRLGLGNGGLLSSSLTTRTSPLGLGGRLSSSLLLSGDISHGLLGPRSSLSLGGLFFLLRAVLVALVVKLLIGLDIDPLVSLVTSLLGGFLIGGLLVLLGARSLLHLLSRLGTFVLGGLGLGLLGLVIIRLWACQYKNRYRLEDSWITNSLLGSGLLLGDTEATHARAIALNILRLAVSESETSAEVRSDEL